MIKRITLAASLVLSLAAMAADGDQKEPQALDVVSSHIEKCRADDAFECYKLGNMYENAFGVGQDLSKALFYYDRSCSLNNAKGCYTIGDIYYQVGDYQILKDEKKAFESYMKSCALNYAEGCRNIGFMLELGEGGVQDLKGAYEAYKLSCSLKLEDGCAQVKRFEDKYQVKQEKND